MYFAMLNSAAARTNRSLSQIRLCSRASDRVFYQRSNDRERTFSGAMLRCEPAETATDERSWIFTAARAQQTGATAFKLKPASPDP
jgi:hypothetical protein